MQGSSLGLLEIILLGIALIACVFVSVVLSTVVAKFFHFDSEKNVKEITESQRQLNEQISKLSSSRTHEYNELKERVERLEEKIEILLMPEGKLKETELEKIRVHKRA